ncbi:GntR family transcriptional regulator [Miniphocaeibacter halophilus]|uniref:GntR family transcriptional regulator n=1 Tax=Miniphocaeibacter halophilus TaxID=2931922 RepID=A0AC61MUR5_9FIRM|nr:GntR family transcriptional regulator [Miniphocaeibacter halophilus]QQK07833.1 GntR family transcriptional regulator [Miniphocaeibacter halophilus]
MIIKLNMQSSTPVYLQLRNEIIKRIASKEINPGEKLPTVRDMAKQVGLNPMTVNKTYQILKEEGIVRTEGRNGVTVREDIVANELFLSKLNNEVELMVTESIVRGFSIEKIIEMINNTTKEYGEVK